MANLSDFKQFVKTRAQEFYAWFKNNEKDILLVIGIVLIAVINFGAGRLTAPKIIQEPLVIKDDLASQLPNSGMADLAGSIGQPINNSQATATSGKQEGKIVASKNGKYYHWPWSPWAKNIKAANRVWFNSETEAQAAGFKRASNFLDIAPAGYK